MAERTEAGSRDGGASDATEKVKEGAQQAREKASHVASDAKEQTRHLAEEGREKAEELAHRAEERARSRAEEEKARVAMGIRTVADSLRQGAQDLPEDRQSYGRVIGTIADRAEGVSRYIEDHDVDEMAREAQRFARDHTAVVIGGAFALGMAGARFLKSSGKKGRDGGYDRDAGYPMRTDYPTDSGYRGDTSRGGTGRYASEGYGQRDAGVDPMEEPLIYGPGEGTEAKGESGGAYSHGEVRSGRSETGGSRMGGSDA